VLTREEHEMRVTDRQDLVTYDVVVIGGGAAGLGGALMLRRSRRSVLVVDAGEPRNAPASGVHGFLTRDGMNPAALVVVLIGFSRMYLGVHYFSDVIAGYAAGGVWLSALITGAETIRRSGRHENKMPRSRTSENSPSTHFGE
jgi:membrane-associated phospholipid phosphatase